MNEPPDMRMDCDGCDGLFEMNQIKWFDTMHLCPECVRKFKDTPKDSEDYKTSEVP